MMLGLDTSILFLMIALPRVMPLINSRSRSQIDSSHLISRDTIGGYVTCDNKIWFYADGQAVIDGNTPGQNNWRVTKHVAVPSDTKVYAIKCVDYHVVGGIIASFGDDIKTDSSWKCTNVYPGAGWSSEYYDDSDWDNAYVIHTNNHASPYWGVMSDISSAAQWIWTRGWHGQDKTVYCRKTVYDTISVDITCDNRLFFYVDGQTVVDGDTPNQNNWRITKHVSVPSDTKVYAIKCVDYHVVGGIIASIGDEIKTDSSWKCTNVYPGAGWLSEYYDDSDWNDAYVIHTNNHASYYWGVRTDISSAAQWIWTTGWHGQDKTVYCRKTAYDTISVDITCDNRLFFYADGQTIIDGSTPNQNNWRITKHVSVPSDTKVYGIKCVDYHVVAGIIASFGDNIKTDSSWKCTKVYPGAGWLSEDYDDSGWNNAYVIHTNNHASYYWGVRTDISSAAQWIWTTGWHGQDKTVYCRKKLNRSRIAIRKLLKTKY